MTTQTTLWEGGQGALALRSERSRAALSLFRKSGRIVVLPVLLALRHEGRNERRNEGSQCAEEAKAFSPVLVLIANARLESRPTVRKQSVRLESNRKRIVVFQFTPQFSQSIRATNHSSLITAVPCPPWPARRGGRLIYGAAIRNAPKALKT
jgi:hypothetical protein